MTPGFPLPPAKHRVAKVAGLLACVLLGAVIGWKLGK
jgi:hypothetical protein